MKLSKEYVQFYRVHMTLFYTIVFVNWTMGAYSHFTWAYNLYMVVGLFVMVKILKTKARIAKEEFHNELMRHVHPTPSPPSPRTTRTGVNNLP